MKEAGQEEGEQQQKEVGGQTHRWEQKEGEEAKKGEEQAKRSSDAVSSSPRRFAPLPAKVK